MNLNILPLIATCSLFPLFVKWRAGQSSFKRLPLNERDIITQIRALQKGSPEAKLNATLALRELAANGQNQGLIRSHGGIALLIKLLRKPSARLQEESISTLTALAEGQNNTDEIRERGGLPELIRLVGNGHAAAQEGAARALWKLARYPENQDAIRIAGGIEPLLQLMREGSEASHTAGVALLNLAYKDQNQKEIGAKGGVHLLIDLLRADRLEGMNTTLELVARLALDETNQMHIRDDGGIQVAINILGRLNGSSQEAQCTSSATAVLRNLALNRLNRDAIRASGGIPRLTDILRHSEMLKQVGCALAEERAIYALWIMAQEKENLDLIRQEDGIHSLMRNAQREGTTTAQKAAASVLAQLGPAPTPTPVPGSNTSVGGDDEFCKSGLCAPGIVTPLTGIELVQELADHSTPVLLDVYATWCGPCMMMAPRLKAVAEQLQRKARVVKLDSDQAQAIVQKLGVSALPTFVVFNNGKERGRKMGMASADDLIKMVETAALPAPTPGPPVEGFCKSGRCAPGVVNSLSGADLPEELDDPSTPMLLDVYATWCGPCVAMAPRLAAVAKTLDRKVRVAKLDSDEAQGIVQQLGVRALPTFLVFNKSGVEVGRKLGMATEDELIKMVESAV